MRRRRNGGPLGDVFDVVASFPWWVGVALAVVAYAVLHFYATGDVVVPRNPKPGQLGDFLGKQSIRALAQAGQYLLPAVFLAAAVGSAIGRRKRRKLVTDALVGQPASVIRDMSWRDFELLVAEGFRLQGFVVTETGGNGPDGGIDLALQKDHERFLVQCKHWRALKVDVSTVRELYGVMAAEGAAGAFVVTSGEFTDDAAAFASGRNIRLINGAQLVAILEKAKQTVTASTRIEPRLRVDTPACPRCSCPMLRRVARHGSNAGKAFWGCSTFPDCRGTLPIG